jgi:hypothetical protein
LELAVGKAEFGFASFHSVASGDRFGPVYRFGPVSWLLLALVLLIFMNLARNAHATWKPEYANAPPEVQNWYRAAQLTEAAQKRFGFKSCCAHSDVVKTSFRVDKATAGDQWYWLKDGEWIQVPSDIIHWGESAPDRQPTLFAVGSLPTCFFPGEGGL